MPAAYVSLLAALFFAAGWTGRNLDERNDLILFIFDGPGFWLFLPLGAGIGWVFWIIPPLRIATQSIWAWIASAIVPGGFVPREFRVFVAGWAIFVTILAFICGMMFEPNIVRGEDWDPGAVSQGP